MSDPGASAKRLRRRPDKAHSSAAPTEPGRAPGPGGLSSISGVHPEATVRVGSHEPQDGRNRVYRAPRPAADELAKERGDHREPTDGKRRSDAKAAKTTADARPGGDTSSSVDALKSKRELYDEARNAGIAGRSAMNKEQLVEALREHRATRSPRQPASEAPGRQPPTQRQPPSRRRAPPSKVDSQVVRPAADSRGPDRCAIVYEGTGRRREFQVVVTETGGAHRSVGRSPSFRAPRFGPLRPRGPARVAHELLVSRLEAQGWWPVDSGGAWHELGFIRLPDTGPRGRRSLVTVVREPGRARFVAEELDDYGNPTPLMLSAPFSAARFLPLRPSRQARAALEQLVGSMESEGWNVAAAVGQEWYAISLRRPTDWNRELLGPRSGAARHTAGPS